MKIRYRFLVSALPVVLVLAALAGSTGSATASYTASFYPTTVTGEGALGNGAFKTEAGSMECKSHFEATLAESSTNLTVKPKYSECKAFGFLSSTITMGSCDYLYTEPTLLASSEENKTHEYTASVHAKCTGGTPITISSGTCEVTIGEQSPGGHVIIKTTTATGDLDTRLEVTGITYTVAKDGIGRPFAGVGVKTGASYIQNTPITFDSINGSTVDVVAPGKEFTASAYPTTGTGESTLGNDVLKAEAGNVECKSHYSSTLTAKSSTLTLTPSYSECKAFGFPSATVKMGGCDYLLNGASVPAGDASTSKFDISCGSEVITITASTCTMLVGPQKGLSKVTITDNTAAGDMSLQAAVTGIEYFVSQDGAGCPFAGTGRKTGASLTQGSAITFDSTNGASIDIG